MLAGTDTAPNKTLHFQSRLNGSRQSRNRRFGLHRLCGGRPRLGHGRKPARFTLFAVAPRCFAAFRGCRFISTMASSSQSTKGPVTRARVSFLAVSLTSRTSQLPQIQGNGRPSILKPETREGPKKSLSVLVMLRTSVRSSSSPLFIVAPIFTKGTAAESAQAQTFHWIEPALGPAKTCLHSINLSPKASSKIAAFDLDGCLIESSIGKKKAKDAPPTFQWWRAVIPKKLKEVHDEG